MNSFLSTLDLLKALKEKLSGLKFKSGAALFDRVEYYTDPDPVRALEELRLFKDKICLVIPDADAFENEWAGQSLQVDCTRSAVLLLSDRDLGRRSKANVTDEGIVVMKDVVEESLMGSNLGKKPRLVRLAVQASQPFVIAGDDAKKQPGRTAWEIDLEGYCGFNSIKQPL